MFLDKTIDKEYEKVAISKEDIIRKNAYCMVLQKDKLAIENILYGKEFDAKS